MWWLQTAMESIFEGLHKQNEGADTYFQGSMIHKMSH